MILMYHKVDIVTPSRWWVSARAFSEQVDLLARQWRCVYLDEYDSLDPSHAVITFDDTYENVYRHAFPLLKRHRLPFELFVIGDLLGDWNEFEPWEMKTRFCDESHLREMADHGGRIQWHTRSHPWLTTVSPDELRSELIVPERLKAIFPEPHLRWFAYPYGAHNEHVVAEARARFAGAVVAVPAVDRSAADRYLLNRVVVDDAWRPALRARSRGLRTMPKISRGSPTCA